MSDWYQRLFAAGLARGLKKYSAAVEPRKRELFGPLHGRVLEIGPGPGTNLRYFAPDVAWIGIDPNPHMGPYLQKEAAKIGIHAELMHGTAEQLPVSDASVDAVVSSLVLCSVDDLPQVLREVRRVLKPGGRFVFIEHVAAPQGTFRRRVQRALRPAWSRFGDGCQPDRETWRAIEAAGFSHVQLEHFRAPLPVVTTHIAGVAVK
jgi:ubiquinone/menaquinone biosynthesis C-methylase UbiE